MHLSENIELTNGLTGGLIIGATTSALLYLTGRITGLSGILEETCICSKSSEDTKWWTWFYSSGLLLSGVVIQEYFPKYLGTSNDQEMRLEVLIVAGIAIGFGTRLGSGCTSGHGISGLPRLSPRSLASVLTFMTTGSIAASLSRSSQYKSLFYHPTISAASTTAVSYFHFTFPAAATAGAVLLLSAIKTRGKLTYPKVNLLSVLDGVVSFVSAFAFGIGLGVGGMLQTERVHRFLDFGGSAGWDYSLMGVMGGGVLLNLISFNFMRQATSKPILSQKTSELKNSIKYGLVPANLKIDYALLVGSALFGLGWGLCGVCPGPALVTLGARVPTARILVPAILGGMALQDLVMKSHDSVPSSKLA